MCILLSQKIPEEREIMCITSEETETSVQFRREKAEAIGTEEKLCPEGCPPPPRSSVGGIIEQGRTGFLSTKNS